MTEPEQTTDPAPNTANLARRLAAAIVVLLLVVVGESVYTRLATDDSNTHSSRAISKAETAATAAQDALTQQTTIAAQAQAAAEQAQFAVAQVKAAVMCINSLLGARGPLTNADTNAEVDIFNRLLLVLDGKPKDQPALYVAFLKATRADVALLLRDKKIRSDHPLGHC